jgi:hypothetical protein
MGRDVLFGLEARVCVDSGLRADGSDLDFGEDEPEGLGGSDACRPSAVADDAGGLVVPLSVDIVDCVLLRAGEGVVVLRDDEHEAVE